MKLYRNPDQYYIDQYDSVTIEELKELERREKEEDKKNFTDEKHHSLQITRSMSPFSFEHKAILRARERESCIKNWIWQDEQKDKLAARHPVPTGIRCSQCQEKMRFCLHFFDWRGNPIMFVFECMEGHAPKKVVYPDGREYIFPAKKCDACGYEVTCETHKAGNIITTVSTCIMCGKKNKDIFDLEALPEEPPPITFDDREKYCLSFLGKESSHEKTVKLFELLNTLDEDLKKREAQKLYDLGKIERLTIPALQEKCQQALHKAGFIKLQFDNPEMKQRVVQPFTVHDHSETNDEKSEKRIISVMQQLLFPTNWRMGGKIYCRLGLLTGKLIASETEADLLLIAKEIVDAIPKK